MQEAASQDGKRLPLPIATSLCYNKPMLPLVNLPEDLDGDCRRTQVESVSSAFIGHRHLAT